MGDMSVICHSGPSVELSGRTCLPDDYSSVIFFVHVQIDVDNIHGRSQTPLPLPTLPLDSILIVLRRLPLPNAEHLLALYKTTGSMGSLYSPVILLWTLRGMAYLYGLFPPGLLPVPLNYLTVAVPLLLR